MIQSPSLPRAATQSPIHAIAKWLNGSRPVITIALNAGAVLVGAAAFAISALAWLIALGWY